MHMVVTNVRKRSALSKVKDIDFRSTRRMKAELEKKIDGHFNSDNQSTQNKAAKSKSAQCIRKPSDQEMSDLFSKLNECKNKPVILSLVSPYADRFILNSRGIPALGDLFDPENLKLNYVDLLTKCSEIGISLSDSERNY